MKIEYDDNYQHMTGNTQESQQFQTSITMGQIGTAESLQHKQERNHASMVERQRNSTLEPQHQK